jgi:hypothetical protein
MAETRRRRPSGGAYCIICVKERSSEYRKKNPEKVKAITRSWYENNKEKSRTKNWKNRLSSDYGLSVEDYEGILEAQDYACLLCGKVNRNGARLSVDHDHKTGDIRGLLCTRCNSALGQLYDDYLLVQRAAEYLIRGGLSQGCCEGGYGI